MGGRFGMDVRLFLVLPDKTAACCDLHAGLELPGGIFMLTVVRGYSLDGRYDLVVLQVFVVDRADRRVWVRWALSE